MIIFYQIYITITEINYLSGIYFPINGIISLKLVRIHDIKLDLVPEKIPGMSISDQLCHVAPKLNNKSLINRITCYYKT